HQGQVVAGDALLAGLEEGQGAEEEVALRVIEAFPVRSVVGEVDGLRIPGAELFGLLEEAHGYRFPVQAATRDGGVALAREAGGHDGASLVRDQNLMPFRLLVR